MSRPFRIILLAIAACLLLPALASAADRPFSPRYSTNVNGQIIIAANTIMQCPTTTVDPLLNSGCTGARAGTNARNNNTLDMGWLDVDSDPSTFDSSTAQLLLPSTGRVLFAGLYWTGLQKKAAVVTGANGYKGTPLAPPDANAIGTVKLAVPGTTGYTTVTASQVDTGPIAESSGYTAFADVTSLVNAAGAGDYTVANVQTGTGGNSFAGWSLVIAYSDPTEPLRNLTVFDGLTIVSSSAFVDIPLSGFKTPTTGTVKTTIGVVAAEGDWGATGDYLTLNDQLLTDAVHPANNTENSTIANRGVHVTTKTPNWVNQLGYDSSLFQADGFLSNGATTAMFRAKTNGDTYAPQAITFATELFSPNVTLTKTASTGGTDAEPGATITYTITATNNGTGDATNVQLRDPVPSGTAITAPLPSVSSGSGNVAFESGVIVARLGSGATSTVGGTLAPGQSATVTYAVTINADASLGDTIANIATLDFVAADLGLPISTVAEADTVVTYPDPGVYKAVTSQSGNTYTFNVTVTNQGTLATAATVTVTEALGAGGTITSLTGTGWSCTVNTGTCTRSGANADALAPGASFPTINVVSTFTPGATVTNTATVSGGGQPGSGNSPATLNDQSTAAAGASPSAVLSVNKAALTGTISLGTLGGFKIQVRNNGPSTATNATMTDTLPAGLAFASITTSQGACTTAPSGSQTAINCALGSIAAGYGAVITVRVRADASLLGTTVTNTATATSDVTASPASDSATLTIRPGADLAIVKTASAATVDQAAAISYTLTATNNGPASATNVQIVDRLPAAVDTGATITSTPSSGGSCSRSGSTITCIWTGATANAATRSVTIAGTTLASVPAADLVAVNRANVFSNTDDPDPSDNNATATVTILPAADLEATAKSDATVAAGASTDLTFSVVNNGPSTATNSTMAISIPSGLTPSKAPAGCTITGQSVACAIGTLTNGASAERVITVIAASDLSEAERTATVTVASNTPDPITTNNTDKAPLLAAPIADLVITKTANVAKVAPGGTINYTIGVANAGPASSTGAVVVDDLPEGLTVASATSSAFEGCTVVGRKVTCNAGEIIPGASYEILIVATVGKDRAGSTFVNTATLTPGAQKDPNVANNEASATVKVTIPKGSAAKLKITGKAKPSSSGLNAKVVISFTVTNTAKVVANDVELCITIPKSLTYLKSAGKRDKSKNRVCFTRDQLKAKKSVTFSYTARTKVPGPVRPRGSAWAGNAAYVSTLAKLGVSATGGGAGGVTG
ncbi:MAG: isopeptide-forming domain-containing fimbrial protein [Actinobacteria bacterium]|nr:isopeptide-forming domain-containing fimbrial protein [Actinomycetota bacterium]